MNSMEEARSFSPLETALALYLLGEIRGTRQREHSAASETLSIPSIVQEPSSGTWRLLPGRQNPQE